MKKIILWFLSICIILLIAFLSSQNGTATAETSGSITSFIANLFFENATQLEIYNLNIALRLLAHYLLFFCFGLFTSAAIYASFNRKFRVINLFFLSSVFIMSLSFLDEWRKQFIEGRHFSPDEALINVTCAFVGIIIIYSYAFIRKKIKLAKS